MAHVKFTLSDKVAAVFLSLLASALVGFVFSVAGAGLFWWNDLPVPRPSAWFVTILVGVITTTFFAVLWQFISGNLLPSELWNRLCAFFTEGNDASP